MSLSVMSDCRNRAHVWERRKNLSMGVFQSAERASESHLDLRESVRNHQEHGRHEQQHADDAEIAHALRQKNRFAERESIRRA